MAGCFRCRGFAKPLIFCILCAIVDFLLSGVLLIHGKDISTFNQRLQVYEFKFCSSAFDLWILSLVRSCTLLGASFGVLFAKRRMDAVSRINHLKKPWLYCGVLVVVCVVGKFLLSTECSLDSNSKIWLWAFMGWTVGSTVMAYGLWYLLGKIKFIGMSTEKENGSIQERERLLHVDYSDDHDDERASSDEKNHTKKEKESHISAWRLLSYCKPDIPYISLASLFLLLAATGEIFIPYYTGEVIDSIAIEKNKARFMTSILIMTLISLGTAIATGLRGGLFCVIAARFTKRISNFLFGSIVKQEIGFFDNTKTGEVVSRLTSDTTKMSDQVGLNINVFLRNCVQSIGTCVFMFKLSWKLSIVTLIGLPLVAFISEIFGNYFKKLSTQVQEATAKANEVAAEVVSSMKTVRSFANEDGEYKRYESKQEAIYRLQMKLSFLYGGYRWCTEILTLTLDVVVLLYGGHLVLEGELSGGNLVSFILYQLQLGTYISEIGDIYTGLLEAVGASQKVFELIDRKPKIQNDGIVNPSKVLGEVRFENVSLHTPQDQIF